MSVLLLERSGHEVDLFAKKLTIFDQIAGYLPVTIVLFTGAKPVSGPKCMIPYMVSYMYTTDPKRA